MKIRTTFRLESLTIPLDKLMPSKVLKPEIKAGRAYRKVAASVREIGVVEPIMVHPAKGMRDKYLILDGHVRVDLLRELGKTEAVCLVAIEDDSFTYNRQISRLAPIQQNKMILRAIDEGGVREERLASALDVSPKTIRDSRGRLANICPEAIELLKDKPITEGGLRALKKVKPMRQIEMADMMIAGANYTTAYAEALHFATPRDQKLSPPAAPEGARPEDIAKLENEMRTLERDYLLIQENHGKNVVNLTLARGYLKKLFDNGKVVRWLAQRQAEVLGELQKVVDANSLEA
jgi:ParB-like chromosome segregation protein Spo0J